MKDNAMHDLRIAFIGGGNMAEALSSGLLKSGHDASSIKVAEPRAERRKQLSHRYTIDTTEDNAAAANWADAVVLAVKPQQMADALASIRDAVRTESTVISIAAGVGIARMRQILGEASAIVRVMPNTPCLLGAGMSVLYADAGLDAVHRQRAEYVLGSAGMTAWIAKETDMHAVTAVSGSGPAYFFLLAELMEAQAQSLGLSKELAHTLVTQTALGAARMLVESGQPANALRAQVASPGGTTEAALEVMYEAGLPEAVRSAIVAAARRSKELV